MNADGSLDTTFDPGTGVNNVSYNVIYSSAILGDGKIIIGGNFTSFNGYTRYGIAKLTSTGAVDTTFPASGTGINTSGGQVHTLAVQSDGKIVIGGGFTTYQSTARGNIARLNTNGSLDTTFLAAGVGTDGMINSLAVQSDGKVLIGGDFATYTGVVRYRIARVNTDGSLDTSFLSTAHDGFNDSVKSVISGS